MTEPHHDGPTGAQFGKYRIIRKLGQGAFGAVYEALLPGPMGFTKRVAVKMLRSSLVDADPRFVQSMVNEARIGGLLHHDNIVDVMEFDQVGERYYLAMEYVDGLTLAEVIRICRDNKILLPRFATVKLAIDICRGLHYAHTLKDSVGRPLHLIHRDLKPSNIIVNATGTAKLLDFGIAKAASNLFNTTASHVTKGTPRYMSPEQIACEGTLTAGSDIFSLGAVLFELLTGRVLFDADSIPGLAFKIIGLKIEDQLDQADIAFPGSRPILEKALKKKPEDRYTDAKAVSEALRELGRRYPAETDMAEVIGRLVPRRDLSCSIEIRDSADLDMETVPWQPEEEVSSAERTPIPPPAPTSAGWDRFSKVFERVPLEPSSSSKAPTEAWDDESQPQPVAQERAAAEQSSLVPNEQMEPGHEANVTTGTYPPPARRLPIVILAFAAVLLAAAALGISVYPKLFGRGVERNAAAVEPEAEPSAEVSEEQPTHPAEVSAPEVIQPSEPAMPAPVEEIQEDRQEREHPEESIQEQADEPAEAPAEEALDEPQEETTEEPAPLAMAAGTISVRTRPWAEIYVDGTLVKEGSVLPRHPVEGGRHEVRLVCPEAGNAEKAFTIDVDGQDAGLGCWDFTAGAPCDS